MILCGNLYQPVRHMELTNAVIGGCIHTEEYGAPFVGSCGPSGQHWRYDAFTRTIADTYDGRRGYVLEIGVGGSIHSKPYTGQRTQMWHHDTLSGMFQSDYFPTSCLSATGPGGSLVAVSCDASSGLQRWQPAGIFERYFTQRPWAVPVPAYHPYSSAMVPLYTDAYAPPIHHRRPHRRDHSSDWGRRTGSPPRHRRGRHHSHETQ